VAIGGQFPAFRGQDAIFDFAKFYFKFPVAGVINGVWFGIFNVCFATVKPGSHFPGKKKGTGHPHRSNGIKFVGIK